MTRPNVIAVIANRKGQDCQTLLSAAANDWRGAGNGVVGVLAENSDAEGTCSAAFLWDVVSGCRFSIQLDAAPAGTTCHLDTVGISKACAELLSQIAQADVVLLSKFGETEAAQQGLWAAFSSTLAAGKPLLTTVSPNHAGAWTEFAPKAIWLETDSRSIGQWWDAVKANAPA